MRLFYLKLVCIWRSFCTIITKHILVATILNIFLGLIAIEISRALSWQVYYKYNLLTADQNSPREIVSGLLLPLIKVIMYTSFLDPVRGHCRCCQYQTRPYDAGTLGCLALVFLSEANSSRTVSHFLAFSIRLNSQIIQHDSLQCALLEMPWR